MVWIPRTTRSIVTQVHAAHLAPWVMREAALSGQRHLVLLRVPCTCCQRVVRCRITRHLLPKALRPGALKVLPTMAQHVGRVGARAEEAGVGPRVLNVLPCAAVETKKEGIQKDACRAPAACSLLRATSVATAGATSVGHLTCHQTTAHLQAGWRRP